MDYLLECADRATDYVWNTLGLHAVNRFEGINRQPGDDLDSYLYLGRIRLRLRNKYFGRIPALKYIFIKAKAASKTKLGNCSEFSCAAFCYLYERGHRDIAIMGSVQHNHFFLLLGGMVNSEYYHFNTGICNIPMSWRNAVICDPWYQESYRVVPDWYSKITQVLYKTSESAHELLGRHASFCIETQYSPYFTEV